MTPRLIEIINLSEQIDIQKEKKAIKAYLETRDKAAIYAFYQHSIRNLYDGKLSGVDSDDVIQEFMFDAFAIFDKQDQRLHKVQNRLRKRLTVVVRRLVLTNAACISLKKQDIDEINTDTLRMRQGLVRNINDQDFNPETFFLGIELEKDFDELVKRVSDCLTRKESVIFHTRLKRHRLMRDVCDQYNINNSQSQKIYNSAIMKVRRALIQAILLGNSRIIDAVNSYLPLRKESTNQVIRNLRCACENHKFRMRT